MHLDHNGSPCKVTNNAPETSSFVPSITDHTVMILIGTIRLYCIAARKTRLVKSVGNGVSTYLGCLILKTVWIGQRTIGQYRTDLHKMCGNGDHGNCVGSPQQCSQ